MAGMNMISAAQRFHAYANPARFMALSARLLMPLAALAALLVGAGLWFALAASPPDFAHFPEPRA